MSWLKSLLGGHRYDEHRMEDLTYYVDTNGDISSEPVPSVSLVGKVGGPVVSARDLGYDQYDMRRTLPHVGVTIREEDREVKGWSGGGHSGPSTFNGMKAMNDTMRRR